MHFLSFWKNQKKILVKFLKKIQFYFTQLPTTLFNYIVKRLEKFFFNHTYVTKKWCDADIFFPIT